MFYIFLKSVFSVNTLSFTSLFHFMMLLLLIVRVMDILLTTVAAPVVAEHLQ